MIDFGKLKRLDTTAVADGKTKSVMTLEATVENKPQELRLLKPYFISSMAIPGSLSQQAQIVLHSLFSCFERQQSVKEGLLEDLVFGFEAAGVPIRLTIDGVRHLMNTGYLSLRDPHGEAIDFSSSKVLKAWVSYEPKLLEMVYG